MNKKTQQIYAAVRHAYVLNKYHDLIDRLVQSDMSTKTCELPSGAYVDREGLLIEIRKLEILLEKKSKRSRKSSPRNAR
jgi:hypothetical protein